MNATYNPTTANETRLKEWLDRLASETDQARHSAEFTRYLRAMARFWSYSRNNVLLILMQRPAAERVNSRKRWGELGYTLRDDEWRNAIQILCPHFIKDKDPQTGEDREVLRPCRPFTTGYIYDQSQVQAGPDAHPLDVPWTAVAGDHAALYRVLHQACRHLSLRVDLRPLPPKVHGSSDGTGHIILDDSLSWGERVHTLVHEMAHEVIHPRAARVSQQFSRQEVECQAEAVSYCVSEALGLPNPNAPVYLALYRVDTAIIKANAEAIGRGVRRILAEVEAASMAEQQEVAA